MPTPPLRRCDRKQCRRSAGSAAAARRSRVRPAGCSPARLDCSAACSSAASNSAHDASDALGCVHRDVGSTEHRRGIRLTRSGRDDAGGERIGQVDAGDLDRARDLQCDPIDRRLDVRRVVGPVDHDRELVSAEPRQHVGRGGGTGGAARARTISSWSPDSCPSVSFTSLNRSRSISTRWWADPSRRASSSPSSGPPVRQTGEFVGQRLVRDPHEAGMVTRHVDAEPAEVRPVVVHDHPRHVTEPDPLDRHWCALVRCGRSGHPHVTALGIDPEVLDVIGVQRARGDPATATRRRDHPTTLCVSPTTSTTPPFRSVRWASPPAAPSAWSTSPRDSRIDTRVRCPSTPKPAMSIAAMATASIAVVDPERPPVTAITTTVSVERNDVVVDRREHGVIRDDGDEHDRTQPVVVGDQRDEERKDADVEDELGLAKRTLETARSAPGPAAAAATPGGQDERPVARRRNSPR